MTSVILAGQSNALGYLNDGPAPYAVDWRVQIWTGERFEVMQPGVNTGTAANPAAWGPEVEFANRWLVDNADNGDILAIGKVVKGSTGLAHDDAALDWSPSSRGELFDQATAVAKAMEAALQTDKIDATLWMQGETDATDAAKADAYAANLADLFAHMRLDWGSTEIAFGRIGGQPEYAAQVRYAEWLVDQQDDHAASFKTLDYAMRPDGLHYADHVQLGAGFYDAWI